MKKYLVIVLSVLMIFMFSSSVVAENDPVRYPDENYTDGKIMLTVKNNDGGLIEGVSLSLYKVADVVNDDNDHSFKKTLDFESFNENVNHNRFNNWLLNLDDTYANDFALLLTDFVNVNNLTPVATKISDDHGEITFDNLSLGLYLLIDNHTNLAYYPTRSFLITVPSKVIDVDPITQEETVSYYYEVVGTPKMELLEDAPPIVPPPTNPPEDNPPTPPETDKKIPNTSVPWGSVYLLGGVGITSLIIGVYCIKKGKHA